MHAAGIVEELEEDLCSIAFPDDDAAGALDEGAQYLCSLGFAADDDEADVLVEDDAGILDEVGDAVKSPQGKRLTVSLRE